jgi:predicted HTH domain antitoxin
MLDYHQLAQETQMTEEELQAQADLLLLLRLYQEGRLSSGQAAQLLGMTRGEFQTLCFQYDIPIDDPSGDPVKEAGYTL